MNDADDESVKEFLIFSFEDLERLEESLLKLEQQPGEQGLLDEIFRSLHTIKGSTGFVGFSRLGELTHAAENLLVQLRDGPLAVTPPIINTLLAAADAVRASLSQIKTSGDEGDSDYTALISELRAQELASDEARTSEQHEPEHSLPSAVSATTAAGDVAAAETDAPPSATHAGPAPLTPEQPESAPQPQQKEAARDADETIRVDVTHLDKLMNQVGELVLIRNRILRHASEREDPELTGASQRLDLITSELQEGVMKTRMQPIKRVWNKFPRVVRNLAQSLDKQIELQMVGGETELDKSLIEAVNDPLTHLVRNAVDHGIEEPTARVAKGKPKLGTVTLYAYHESGQVNVEITDDGAGIDPQSVIQKALERDLISPAQAEALSELEALQLIFLPGLSTARQVSDISGRGVGMDVVKTAIHKIGGSIDVNSTLGQGTTVTVKVPLTLAIVSALIVGSGNGSYAIPQLNLVELVRLSSEEMRLQIEFVHDAPVYRLRNKLLPLVYLHRQLQLQEDSAAGAPDEHTDGAKIVVLQAGDRQFGLVVDDVNDTQEIVVKPLSNHLKDIPVFAGATIMGDGSVALVLDVLGLGRRAHVISSKEEQVLLQKQMRAADGPVEAIAETDEESLQQLLLLKAPDGGRMAVPLRLVDRLERFPVSLCERSGGRVVVQYGNCILPLVNLSEALPGRSSVADEPRQEELLHTVVYSSRGGKVGVVVPGIIDVVEQRVAAEPQQDDNNFILGTAVIDEQVTELLNLATLAERSVAGN